ncbi:MAG: Hsp20/alpha crystallin family protein, partial [Propionibacteriaceae bacterium]|nr:Hsp20/alpha crystallin family protein [Propionibacteriaceae bacterium]
MASEQLTPREKQEVQGGEQTRPGRYYVPDVDIAEGEDGLWLYADMPGVEPDAVSVELHDNVLTVQGEVSPAPYEGLTPIYSEYRVGSFLRRFALSPRHRFDPARVSAKLV